MFLLLLLFHLVKSSFQMSFIFHYRRNMSYEKKSFPQFVYFFSGDLPIRSEHIHVFFKTQNVALDT